MKERLIEKILDGGVRLPQDLKECDFLPLLAMRKDEAVVFLQTISQVLSGNYGEVEERVTKDSVLNYNLIPSFLRWLEEVERVEWRFLMKWHRVPGNGKWRGLLEEYRKEIRNSDEFLFVMLRKRCRSDEERAVFMTFLARSVFPPLSLYHLLNPFPRIFSFYVLLRCLEGEKAPLLFPSLFSLERKGLLRKSRMEPMYCVPEWIQRKIMEG